jgi:hypothetical protein
MFGFLLHLASCLFAFFCSVLLVHSPSYHYSLAEENVKLPPTKLIIPWENRQVLQKRSVDDQDAVGIVATPMNMGPILKNTTQVLADLVVGRIHRQYVQPQMICKWKVFLLRKGNE